MALRDSLQELQNLDLAELSFDNIGSWPAVVKGFLLVFVFAALVAGGYQFLISDMELQLESTQKRERDLKKTFEQRAHEAANLDAYRKQMQEIEEKFGVLLGQLPSDTEVPGLLDDISDIGVSNGLRFEVIELRREVQRDFYIELPIAIKVVGSYHDFGAFVSGVSALPRIVTLHDFNIKSKDRNGDELEMSIVAKTYRYRE